ncbi:agmatinase [Candidatus Omnitrophota bacterium]
MAIFGGRDNNLSAFKDALVVVLPVPYGKTVTYRKGTEKGPAAILDASDNMELFDEELNREVYTIGINTVSPLKVADLKPEEVAGLVRNSVSDVLKEQKFPVVIGGEHSVTIGAVKAAKDRYKDLSVLYFDAHCDLKDSYDGSMYNHACVARRLSEIAPLIVSGTRSLSKEESSFLKSKDIKNISMLDILADPNWAEKVIKYLSKNIYISIDLDVFDPSIMPSVGTPEPGGIKWYDFLKAIRSIISSKNVVGFDVTELCPIKDMIAPDFTAARLIYKIIGYKFFK